MDCRNVLIIFEKSVFICEIFMFQALPHAWGRGASPIQQLAEGLCWAEET